MRRFAAVALAFTAFAILAALVLAWPFMPRIQVIQNLGGKPHTVMQFP